MTAPEEVAAIMETLYAPELCFWCNCRMFDRHKLGAYPEFKHHQKVQRRMKTRDHFVPRSTWGRGFTVPSCFTCNQLKGSMDPMWFRDAHRPNVSVAKIQATLAEAKFQQERQARGQARKKNDANRTCDKMPDNSQGVPCPTLSPAPQ